MSSRLDKKIQFSHVSVKTLFFLRFLGKKFCVVYKVANACMQFR